MDITWYGHSCFRLNERNLGSVVCDPYDYEKIGYEPLKLKADIVTVSTQKPGHNYTAGIKTNAFVIDSPGEYEINDIFVTGHAVNRKGEPRSSLYVIEFNGVFVAHLGCINRPPTESEVESLGDVDVLLVPVGGGSSLNAEQAAETIRMIQPRFAIPMHYAVARTIPELDPLSKFLKVMGISEVPETYTTFKVPAASKDEKDEATKETKIIIMEHPLGNESAADEEEASDAA